MHKNYIIISAVLGALGVTFGAFGAHGLKTVLTQELLETYKTGVFYHIIHSVVLLTLSLNTKYKLKFPFYFIFIGVILFSFSLYVYTLTSITYFAMITPIGGLSLVIGWIMIIVSILKK